MGELIGHDKRHCVTPDVWSGSKYLPEGLIWRCECGQLWITYYPFSSIALRWKRISERKRRRLEHRDVEV